MDSLLIDAVDWIFWWLELLGFYRFFMRFLISVQRAVRSLARGVCWRARVVWLVSIGVMAMCSPRVGDWTMISPNGETIMEPPTSIFPPSEPVSMAMA